MPNNKKEQQIFSTYNLDKLNERIILAFLSTPIKNAYTNFSKIGEELYEESNDTEIRTCQRMMKILKLNHIPSRKYMKEMKLFINLMFLKMNRILYY